LLVGCLVAAACGDDSDSQPDLAGTSWNLGSFSTPGGSPTPAATSGAAATLTFASDGRIAGSTGCNAFTGTYLVSASRLTIEPRLTTRTACANPELEAQQSAINRQLPQVRGYSLNDDVLVLTGETGRTLLTYNARAA
jgi:heat shock protein HslJ